MKIYMKRRISVFLCLLLTVPAILGALPQAELEAQAAMTTYMSWNGLSGGYDTEGPEIQVTKATKNLYIGDFLSASVSGDNKYQYYAHLSLNSGVKYKSSVTSVASINASTGLVTPKKAGSTKVTITFKGVSKTCIIKVVSSLGKVPSSYSALKKASNVLIKAYGKKITLSNRYKVVNARNQYLERRNGTFSGNINTYYGVESISNYDSSSYTYKNTNKAYMPELAHAGAINGKIIDYVKSVNPIGTGGAKLFKVSSVSGKGSNVKAKVSGKVTDNQIFGIKASVSTIWDTKIAKGNTAKFPLYLQDVKTGHKYYAIATVSKGKNVMSIKLQNAKLKKNTSYKLVGITQEEIYRDWANWGKTKFKAK